MPVENKDEEREDQDVDEIEAHNENEREEFIKEYLEERKMYNEDDDWDTGSKDLGATTTEDSEEADISKAGFHVEENKDSKEKI